jgi:hypothetical protein
MLAIEMNELWGSLNTFSDRIVRTTRPVTKKDAKIITLGVRDLFQKSNYQDFARFRTWTLRSRATARRRCRRSPRW